jgi:hypothetical protein
MTTFLFDIILSLKTKFQFKNFEIWIFQMTSDGETPKMKVVGLKKLWKFVVDNFLIWSHLAHENYVWIS